MALTLALMLLCGYPAFAILFVAAGTGRFVAARISEVSPPAPVPQAEPADA